MKQDGKTDGRRDQWVESQTERVCQMDERTGPHAVTGGRKR